MELEEREKAERRKKGKSGGAKGQKRKAESTPDSRGRPKKKKWWRGA